jgi:hypothetical protein
MTKTQIGILWGLGVLVLVIFVVLSQVISRSSGPSIMLTAPPAKVYRLPENSQSARSLYLSADQAARSWQGDAQLVSATASWSFAQEDDLSGPVDWTFQFYSPGTQQLFVVSVSEETATPITNMLSPYELPVVAIENWRIDSHEALGVWLTEGGAAFLKGYSVVDVSARLRHSQEGRLEWSVAGVVRDSQLFHLVQVDASSGKTVK